MLILESTMTCTYTIQWDTSISTLILMTVPDREKPFTITHEKTDFEPKGAEMPLSMQSNSVFIKEGDM